MWTVWFDCILGPRYKAKTHKYDEHLKTVFVRMIVDRNFGGGSDGFCLGVSFRGYVLIFRGKALSPFISY